MCKSPSSAGIVPEFAVVPGIVDQAQRKDTRCSHEPAICRMLYRRARASYQCGRTAQLAVERKAQSRKRLLVWCMKLKPLECSPWRLSCKTVEFIVNKIEGI